MGAKSGTAVGGPALGAPVTFAAEIGDASGRVVVHPDGEPLAEWLDEFFRPGLTVVAADPAAPVVRVVDADAGTELGGSSAPARTPVPCFALDRSVVEHPAHRTADGILVIDDEQYGTRIVLGADSVTIVRRDPAPRSRAGVMRVVRELVTAQAVAVGALQLHAGALARDGRVAVLAGPKQAGKTTLVARLAGLGLGAIAANDRLLLAADPGPGTKAAWHACPIGTVVSVRPGTRALFPALTGPFPAVRSPAHLTVAELAACAARDAAGAGGDTAPARVTLSPAQFAHALGAPRSAGGRVAGVLLLAIDPDLDGYRITPLDADAAEPALAAVEYGCRPVGLPRTVFEDWLGIGPAAPTIRRYAAFAASAAVRMLTVGPRVLRDDGCARDLADEVFAGG